MTDADYTHFVILADRTGSMDLRADGSSPVTKAQLTTKGIKDLIVEQARLGGRVTFTLVDFDDMGYTTVADFAPGDSKDIAAWAIKPRGGTPLLDAVGKQIVATGEALEFLPEDARPGKVYFVIGSDGEENSSREYTKSRVAEMVRHQTDAYGWEFIFIGADIDAFGEAGGMGFSSGSTLGTSGGNMSEAYNVTSAAISRSRLTKTAVAYSAAERSAVA